MFKNFNDKISGKFNEKRKIIFNEYNNGILSEKRKHCMAVIVCGASMYCQYHSSVRASACKAGRIT